MKLDNVTQWVRVDTAQVPPDQSLANRSEEKSAGKPGNGSPKPDGSRVQALYGAPKYVESWSTGRESRQHARAGRQQSGMRYGERSGHHRGLRPGHVVTG